MSLQQKMMEEWYHLYEAHQTFQKQNPTSHPLYKTAINNLKKSNSLDYHQGVYQTLVNVMRMFPVAKEAEREQMRKSGHQPMPKDAPPPLFEVIVHDIVRLQIGHTLEQILKYWPEEHTPSIKTLPPQKSKLERVPQVVTSAHLHDDDDDDAPL